MKRKRFFSHRYQDGRCSSISELEHLLVSSSSTSFFLSAHDLVQATQSWNPACRYFNPPCKEKINIDHGLRCLLLKKKKKGNKSCYAYSWFKHLSVSGYLFLSILTEPGKPCIKYHIPKKNTTLTPTPPLPWGVKLILMHTLSKTPLASVGELGSRNFGCRRSKQCNGQLFFFLVLD